MFGAIESYWQTKNFEDQVKHEMSMKQMGMSRIVVEVKRVM
jgi:hypothetical protein